MINPVRQIRFDGGATVKSGRVFLLYNKLLMTMALTVCAVVGSAQELPKRTLGRRLQRPVASAARRQELQKTTTNGVEWTYKVVDGGAFLGGGFMQRNPSAVPQNTSGALIIPETLAGMPVREIGSGAFFSCTNLTSVSIPSSVTSVAGNAFDGCNGLTSFVVDPANPTYSSTNGLLCSKDGRKLIRGVNGDVEIPTCVTNIGYGAFDGRKGLTSVTMPPSVTSIGSRAFEGCSGLISVTIPSSVERIAEDAFCGTPFYANIPDGMVILGGGILYKYKGKCPNSVTIPEGVKSISNGAFGDCRELLSVALPSSVISIGREAFFGCGRLKSVTIPSSVKSIEEYAFYDCSGLTSVTIPSSVTSIGERAFSGCSGLTSVTMPEGVMSIGFCAFYGCSGLTSVIIPSSVTSIVGGVFCDCSGLKSVTIPSSVTSIGVQAFSGCSGLTSVTIPSSVTSIGERAFFGCSGLTSLKTPDSVIDIHSSAFSGCTKLGIVAKLGMESLSDVSGIGVSPS